jgi:hypothetical protein
MGIERDETGRVARLVISAGVYRDSALTYVKSLSLSMSNRRGRAPVFGLEFRRPLKNRLKRWLTTLDDFRNWLIRAA